MPTLRARIAIVAVAVAVLALSGSAVVGGSDGVDGAPQPASPPPPASASATEVRPPVVTGVQTDEPVVGLSFDDGPDPRWTPTVLSALAGAGARATFFVTGEHVRAHPELLRDVVAAGHEIANHTDSHPHIQDLSVAEVRAEVQRAAAAIAEAGAPAAPWFRPPRGRYDDGVLVAVTEEGLQTVGWTVCLERWLRRGPALGVEEAVARVRPGAIVLAHDGGIPDRSATVAALPAFLARLSEKGFRVVTVGEVLASGPPVLGLPGAGPSPAILVNPAGALTPARG